MASTFSQNHLLNRESLPHCLFLSGLSKIRWLKMCGIASEVSVLFHCSISLFWYRYHAVLINVALYYSLTSGRMMSPALFLLLRIVLVMQALFWFHIKFKVVFFQFCEEGQWWLEGDNIESINYFGQYGHFHDIDSS